MKTILAAVLTAWTGLPCSAQATWTVNSAGGAQFTTIQAAIAAAAPGDRIEVQGAGPYGAFVVDRGVEVESLTGAISGSIEVVGVPAGQRARVSGFVVDQTNNGWTSVRACAGGVLLAGVAYTGANGVAGGARPGLEVLDSPNVLVDHCDFRGHSDSTSGAPGASITNSQVVFVGASVLGGVYAPASPSFGNSGRDGIQVTTSHVTMRGTTVRGGASSGAALVGGNGGHALHVVSGLALVLGQCQLRGASGSFGSIMSGSHGDAARGNVRYTADTLLIGSAATATAIPNRPVVVGPGGVFIGTTLNLFVLGDPGQPVLLGLDLDHLYLPLPVFDGTLVLTGNAVLVPLTLDALGTGTLPLPIPNLPALQHLNVFVQGIAIVAGALVLTAPTVTHTL